MIPNHTRFIEAIHEKKKVCVRFYSRADSGLRDRVCAPMDYGPGAEIKDGEIRYWLWDYASNTGFHTFGLVPRQIMDLNVLGEVFDPAHLDVRPPQWSIPRDWGSQSQPMEARQSVRNRSAPSPPQPLADGNSGPKPHPPANQKARRAAEHGDQEELSRPGRLRR